MLENNIIFEKYCLKIINLVKKSYFVVKCLHGIPKRNWTDIVGGGILVVLHYTARGV